MSSNPLNAAIGAGTTIVSGAIIGGALGTKLLRDGPKRQAAIRKIDEWAEVEEAGQAASIAARVAARREIASRRVAES